MKLDKEKLYLISETQVFFPFLTDKGRNGIRTIWNWVRSGKLKAHKIGGYYRIKGEDLERFLEGK